MAHRTRKKLTKTELKKDPVNDGLMKGMIYLQDHIKQFLIGGIAIVVLVLVFQSLSGNAERQADECLAQYTLAGQLYRMGLENLLYNDVETAIGQLQTAQQIAQNNYRSYPGKEAGKRSALLSAKISIMFGMNSEVITELQDLIASDPGIELENSASLHLAIALENRGGENDLVNALELYDAIIENTSSDSQLAWESYSGKARILYIHEDYVASRENLEIALEISGTDTTDFEAYQIALLQMQMN